MFTLLKLSPIALFITLIKNRFLLANFIKADLKERYQSSKLGFLWTILHPLVLMMTYCFIFSCIFNYKIESYPIFLLTGLIPWIFFSSSLSIASHSISGNFHLINKIYFPRELFPSAVVFSNFIHLIFSFIVLSFFLVYFKIQMTFAALFLPIIFIIQLILTLALAFIVSSIAVFLKDIRFILDLGLQILFFCSPVLYKAMDIPEKYANLFYLNPLVGILEAYKNIILFGSFPLNVSIFYSAAFSFILLIIAYAMFKRVDYLFAEVG